MEDFFKTASFINNTWVDGALDEFLSINDKYTHENLSQIYYLDEAQVDYAIESAQSAFSTLKEWDSGMRSKSLLKLAKLIEDRKEDLAELICMEAGKPINYARGEVNRCITTVTIAAEEAKRICGEVIPMNFDGGVGREAFTKRFPIGVIGCISPFNFPMNLALHKIAPALACGNTIVLKPSPYTPLSALVLAEMVSLAGFPKGSVNVVICKVDEAEKLVTDERISMVSFTGSPAVGWLIKENAPRKKVCLELGGNAAVIIDKSADLDHASTLCSTGSFLYSGQICISTQRIYIHEEVYEDFKSALLTKTSSIEVGDPKDEDTIVGPLIDKVHLQRINQWVQEAISKGASVVSGGQIIDERSNIFAPTILENCQDNFKVVSEEVFGPVVILEKFKTFDEAITKTNKSKFGLQAGVFTNQIDHFKYAFNHLEVGGVMLNNIPGFRIDNMPYGGIKDSGFGREGIRYAIDEMTEMKLVVY